MIRKYRDSDLNPVMQIWFDTNKSSHSFISEAYWTENYHTVKELLPTAEVYVYEDETCRRIEGFIGLIDTYIAGIFVESGSQSQGIGKQLLDHAKSLKSSLQLRVYQMNKRAIRFYQREQFWITSESMDNDTQEAEFVMIWPYYPERP